MTLSPSQVAFFQKHGYVTHPALFTEREVAGFLAELERFKREQLYRNVSTAGDGKTHTSVPLNIQVIPLFDKSPLLRALPFHPRVGEAITQLIGAPAILHLDQIFLKPPKHGAGTSWHQDNYYFQVADPMRGVGMWIALHEATIANGTMHIVPDNFREKLEHTRDLNSDHHFHCRVDESKVVPIELPAGGALFFCYGVPHCTKGNTTERERAGLALHFVREDHAPAELVQPGRRERPVINGPESTGGVKEYGVRVAGTFEEELDKVMAAAAV